MKFSPIRFWIFVHHANIPVQFWPLQRGLKRDLWSCLVLHCKCFCACRTTLLFFCATMQFRLAKVSINLIRWLIDLPSFSHFLKSQQTFAWISMAIFHPISGSTFWDTVICEDIRFRGGKRISMGYLVLRHTSYYLFTLKNYVRNDQQVMASS